ncbi:MAG TPA: hypothetical protein PLY52_10345, partial [Methanothrix sp.]|nr:hypothetical protein [Methanothrix sp.]
MINLEIEEIGKEKGLLIRSCQVKINGNTIKTPTRTIGATLSNTFELKEARRYINNKCNYSALLAESLRIQTAIKV